MTTRRRAAATARLLLLTTLVPAGSALARGAGADTEAARPPDSTSVRTIGSSTPPSTAPADEPAATPDTVTITGIPMSELTPVELYEQYLVAQLAELGSAVRRLTEAVGRGDTEGAQIAYPMARRPWIRIAAAVDAALPELAAAIEGRAASSGGTSPSSSEVADPSGTAGWPALEAALWGDGSSSAAEPVAEQLARDIADLTARLPEIVVTPELLAATARDTVAAAGAPEGPLFVEGAAAAGLYDVQAAVEGAQTVFELYKHELSVDEPELLGQLDGRFTAAYTDLRQFGSISEGFVPVSELTDDQRDQLIAELDALSSALGELGSVITGA